MIALDIRTLAFLYVVCNLASSVFLASLWRQNRRHFAGIDLWLAYFAMQTAALILLILRGTIPDWASIVVANSLMVAGAVLLYVGLRRFVGKPGGLRRNLALLGVFVLAFGYYALVRPDLQLRTLILSLALLLLGLQAVWLLWRQVEPPLRSLSFATGLVFVGYCLLSVLRIAEFFFGTDGGDDFFHSGNFQALVLTGYQVLAMLLTYSLVLMVNQRLIGNIDEQRERFAKAFHAAPYAISLTRMSDGALLDVNRNFELISGYGRSEVLGRKSTDLKLWQRPEDRDAILDALSSRGELIGVEMLFRGKSGQEIVGVLSAQVLPIAGEQCVLSCIADISERKAREQELQRQSEALQARNDELDRFNRLAVGRELQMVGLKQQVNALSLLLGREAPYRVEFTGASPDPGLA